MILHINHVPPDCATLASSVVSTLVSIAGEGQIQPRILENLNVHLDWVQYKTNFRESVTLRRAVKGEELLPWIEVGVDLRQLQPETLRAEFLNVLKDGLDGSGCSADRVYLEPFTPMRSCLIWRFNDLFWKHLPLWEAASGKGFEKALPGGTSDANHPEAVARSEERRVGTEWKYSRSESHQTTPEA